MDQAVRPVLFPLSTAAASSHRKTTVKGEKIIKFMTPLKIKSMTKYGKDNFLSVRETDMLP